MGKEGIYESFILRLWQEETNWRARLEVIGPEAETIYFATPQSLVDFLEARKQADKPLNP